MITRLKLEAANGKHQREKNVKMRWECNSKSHLTILTSYFREY